MRSVLRGVTLFAVGTMLCAGLVFTADRGIGVNSSKADRVRADEVGEIARPMHPTRVHRVSRDDVMDFLNQGQRASDAANSKVDHLIEHAQALAAKGDLDGAIDFMQSTRGIEIPGDRMGEYHSVLGNLYAQGTTVTELNRAAGNLERAASYAAGRDEAVELLQRAGDLYGSAGRIDAVARVNQSIENARRGRTIEFGQAGSGLNDSLQTIGVADSCDAAIAAVLPYNQAGINIDFGDHDWYTFEITEPSIVVATTNAGPGTFDDDTDLALFDFCEPGLTYAGNEAAAVAFDDDSGPGFLSALEACVAPGTYYLELGGWFDSATPNDITLDIATAGTCFIPVADEFEPDNEVGASFIGCDTLAAEDEENEDEEDEQGSDSEDDESSEDAGFCGDDDLTPYCLDGETICLDVDDSSSGDPIPDGAEPGECPDPGTVCELLQTQCRTIFPAGDIDFVVFNAGDEPRRIVVETGPSLECGNTPEDIDGTGPDTIIAITDAFGNIFAVNDDKGGGSFGSRFEFCAPANQDFNVAVLGFSASDTFAYQLTADATTPCTTETEANGSCALANDLGPIPADGTPVIVGGFRTPFQDPFGATFVEDQDWYTFTLPAGGCDVTILTDATDTIRTDTELEAYIANTFFDPLSDPCTDVDNGVNSVGFSDDLDAFGGVYTSGLAGNLPEAQYFVRVSASQAFASPGPPFVYDLIVFCDPPPMPDAFEPNDTPATATPISLGTGATASIHVPGDVDFYTFDLTGDTQVLCDTATPDGAGDTVIELLSGPNLISCDDDSSTNGTFLASFECCLPPGSYVVGVKDWQSGGGPGDSTLAEYTLTCTNLAPCSADPDPVVASCFDDGDPFGQCPF